MKIAVIGTGYVGLVTGTCLAELGNRVICVDNNEQKVAQLRERQLPIFEPGLSALFERNVSHRRLEFTASLCEGIESAEVIFLALPTPQGEDGAADLTFVLDVVDELGGCLRDYAVIINKSTVPVGTAERVAARIDALTDVPFDIVSNPEFLRQGEAVDDFMKPERVVIGTSSSRAKAVMERLYAPFDRLGVPLLFMDERSAELTKYAANAFLATKISFMNEVANLCERLGADVDSVRTGIGSDGRIGPSFLFAGIGYGGSCFPKDVRALSRIAHSVDGEFRILDAVNDVNESQRLRLFAKVNAYFLGELAGKTVAVWGLSYKANTDDVRESPALANVQALVDAGAHVRAFDPQAMERVSEKFGETIELCIDEYEAVRGADALFIATDWPEFRSPDFARLGALMEHKAIFDGRNLYEVEHVRGLGFNYFSIGREQIG